MGFFVLYCHSIVVNKLWKILLLLNSFTSSYYRSIQQLGICFWRCFLRCKVWGFIFNARVQFLSTSSLTLVDEHLGFWEQNLFVLGSITRPFLVCYRRRRRCTTKSKWANRGGPRGGSKARKLTSDFDRLEQLLDVFRLQEHAGTNLFPWASWWKRKCMCLHCWNPLNTMLKMGYKLWQKTEFSLPLSLAVVEHVLIFLG